jgi:acetate kinase
VRVLVVNAGSSSLKLRVLDSSDKVTGTADLPAPRGAADAAAMESTLASLGDADAVGYRIVHGGTSFTAPVRIDDGVLATLRALTDLAPLHQPKSLAAVAAVQRVLPGVPGVACFDTAFHATIPAAAATYALPREWRQRWALRRYGFHGLSHSYAARRAAELAGGSRTVTCHLGAGASLAAVRDGVSVDTTMGFTPLEGLVMATRSGSVDPGLVLWLADHAGTPVAELAAALEHRSGLLGLAGTADMREVVAGAAAGLPDARLGLDVYTHRLRAGIAAMAAALGGLDVLVFTGGVGENSPVVRSEAAAGLGFLGVRLDAGRNEADGFPVGDPAGGNPAGGNPAAGDPAAGGSAADREIGDPGAPVRSFVIAAREDIEIAGQVRAVLER